MFEKRKLNRAIRRSKQRIELLEKKRYRSQAALVDALLTHSAPNDEDVEYFNLYTSQIEKERAYLHEKMAKLEALV